MLQLVNAQYHTSLKTGETSTKLQWTINYTAQILTLQTITLQALKDDNKSQKFVYGDKTAEGVKKAHHMVEKEYIHLFLNGIKTMG